VATSFKSPSNHHKNHHEIIISMIFHGFLTASPPWPIGPLAPPQLLKDLRSFLPGAFCRAHGADQGVVADDLGTKKPLEMAHLVDNG